DGACDHQIKSRFGIYRICRKCESSLQTDEARTGSRDLLTVCIVPGTCLILIAYPQVCASPGSSLGNSCFCVDRGRISAPLFQGNILGPADITAQGIALDLQ